MSNVLHRVSGILKCRSLCRGILIFQETVIDNVFFRLQHRLTIIILLLLSLAVALRQLFGSTIHCMTREFSDYIQDHCYVHPTYSIEEAWNNSTLEISYPGVFERSKGTRIYHYYYQWVAIVLFLQAVLFMIPWYVWRTMGENRVREALREFRKSKNTLKGKLQLLSEEITFTSQNWSFLAAFIIIEFLNVVNVIGQIFLMDYFLGGSFLTYGSEVIRQPKGTPENLYDPMVRLFPRVAMCDVKRVAVSGSIQLNSYSCSLPLNSVYDKIYLFLWFWFIILAVSSSLALIYRLVVIAVPQMRGKILKVQTISDTKTVLYVSRSLNVGNWFFLYMLNKSLKQSWRGDLLLVLSEASDNNIKSDSQELEYIK